MMYNKHIQSVWNFLCELFCGKSPLEKDIEYLDNIQKDCFAHRDYLRRQKEDFALETNLYNDELPVSSPVPNNVNS